MSPIIGHSVVKLTESCWQLGSSMICESDLVETPSDALASWTSDEGKTFHLRRSPNNSPTLAAEDTEELSQVNRVHQAGTGAAVWAFGGVHVKAKAWVPGLEAESDTVEHVRKTGLPVPAVVFSWVDTTWNRSFLILRSIKGRTLFQAWPVLSHDQKSQIADQIALILSNTGPVNCSTDANPKRQGRP